MNALGRWLTLFVTAALVLCFAGVAFADPLMGPTWPAPGSNLWTASGPSSNVGQYGGLTFGYWNFDPSAYDSLYWGPWSSSSSAISMDGPPKPSSGPFAPWETLSFSSSSGNVAYWSGSTYFDYYYFPAQQWRTAFVNTRMTVTVSGGAGPWAIEPGIGPLVQVTGPTYSANILMEAYFPSDGRYSAGWKPVEWAFDRYENQPGNYLSTNASFGFFYEPKTQVIPEPTSWALVVIGAAGLVWLRRRRRAE